MFYAVQVSLFWVIIFAEIKLLLISLIVKKQVYVV